MSEHQRTNVEELGIASIETLQSLAAEGKFVSATHCLPSDWIAAEWKFFYDGFPCEGKNLVEVFAPDNDYGWAVAYIKNADGEHTGETELIRGNWTIERVAKEATAPTDGSELSEASIG